MANLRTLDLNLLRVFDALMRTRSVTRAAETLGLTQPAVSAALSRLRGHLGDPLLVRVGNAMVPTDRALALAEAVVAALQAFEVALDETAPFDPAGSDMVFTLRGADFFSMRLMPVLAARLSVEAPGVTLRFLDSGRGDLLAMLEAAEIDLALEAPMETPGWVSRAALFASPFVVVAAGANAQVAASSVAPGSEFPLSLFCALPHALRSTDGSMRGMTDTALERQGLSRRVALVLPHFEAIMMAVAQSELISVVPVQLAAEVAGSMGLKVYRPPVPIPVPQLQLYWHSRLDRAAPHVWMRRRLQQEVARLWGADASFD